MASTGPVDERQRIAELDVLRGIALLGVLLMNFIGFAGEGIFITAEQRAALSTAALDEGSYFAIRWLVGDKANTVFATLFGLGFYLQLRRSEQRPGFEARYRRRLSWLFVFGVLNVMFLWVWDVLHVYALAGFFLLATRRWRTRSLVVFGAIAALYSDKMQEWLVATLGLPIPTAFHYFTDEAIVERQALAQAGDYFATVSYMWHWTLAEWLLGGMMVAWMIYALGRFALGAAIGRSGILDDLPRFIPLLRRIAWICIPAGLAVGLVVRLLYTGSWEPLGDSDGLKSFGQILRSPAALLLSAGYCAGVVVALQRNWGQRLFGPFGAVGRMALTNYLAQAFLYAFVLFGVGPGLALGGRIGTFAVAMIGLAFFAGQIVFSHWWLARYRFGPMEWLWRALTYRERPAMRRAAPALAT